MRRTLHALHLRHTTPDRRAARLLARHTPTAGLELVGQSASPLAELEEVLDRFNPRSLLTSDSVGAHALRGAVRRLAADARAQDPRRAELLLLSLRCAWRDFPRVRQLADEQTRDVLWYRLVRLCCEEFYGTRADGLTERADRRNDARGDGLTARVAGRFRLA